LNTKRSDWTALRLLPCAWLNNLTNSSVASEPLFPDSVEAMRLVRGYIEAFGLNKDEFYTVCTRNPGKVVGLSTACGARSGFNVQSMP
jgi:hypothetical protein